MNLNELAKRLEIEEEECLDFLLLFRKTTASELSNLEIALEKKEASIVERMAHSIKGAAGILGLTEIYETARRIEALARMNCMEGVEIEFQSLKKELETLF